MSASPQPRVIPPVSEMVASTVAVAGHAGTLSSEDGELFVKPCTKQEIKFYEDSVLHPEFAKYMPVYLGDLTLVQQAQPNPEALLKAGAQLLAEYDLAVKLDPTDDHHHAHLLVAGDGTITADTSAHVCGHPSHHGMNGTVKVEHEQVRTTLNNPLELAGPNKTAGKMIDTDKAIVLENAAHGFVRPNILDVKLGVVLYDEKAKPEKKARFDKVSAETTHKNFGFRIAGMRVWQGEGAAGEHINSEGYRVYDKNYGRLEVHDDNIEDAFRNFLFSESAGINAELGKEVSRRFLADVLNIEQVINNQDSEMFSASLLFVYEGDGAALKEALEEEKQMAPRAARLVGDGASIEKKEEGYVLGNGQNREEEEAESEEDEEDEDEGPRTCVVKVIDFAHATWKTEGSGQDYNSLKGVSSVANILARIAGVERPTLPPRGVKFDQKVEEDQGN